jgi:hypothetical protein
LTAVAEKENFKISEGFSGQIAQKSDRNLRSALLMLEVEKTRNNNEGSIEGYDWQVFIARMALEIMEEQSPQK